MIPQAGPEEIAGDRFTLPGIATDHEGDGRVDRLFDGGHVGSRSAFSPADEAVVGREADDRVGHPAACDAAADLVVEIGDAHIPGLEASDSHRMAAGGKRSLGACPLGPNRFEPRQHAGRAPYETILADWRPRQATTPGKASNSTFLTASFVAGIRRTSRVAVAARPTQATGRTRPCTAGSPRGAFFPSFGPHFCLGTMVTHFASS